MTHSELCAWIEDYLNTQELPVYELLDDSVQALPESRPEQRHMRALLAVARDFAQREDV